MQSEDSEIKSGMVAIVGPPNAGKSTLLNSLLGQKISIVTPKPQTTRNRVVGIVNGADYQIVLIDTPGLHTSRQPLNREMVGIALASLSEVDAVLFLIDVSVPPPENNRKSFGYLDNRGLPVILILNKIDLVEKASLLPMIERYSRLYPFSAIVPVAALHNEGIELLLSELLAVLPFGPRYYPDDIPTDATERFIVAEIIREKIFLLTGSEIPYATAVLVDSFREEETEGRVVIHATIYVEKGSQKGIIIGRGGSRLKEIGSRSRREIEEFLAHRVHLELWVKVRKHWTRNRQFLKELGM